MEDDLKYALLLGCKDRWVTDGLHPSPASPFPSAFLPPTLPSHPSSHPLPLTPPSPLPPPAPCGPPHFLSSHKVRVSEDVDSGTELTINWLGEGITTPLHKRREALQSAYGFKCECRCVSDTDSRSRLF